MNDDSLRNRIRFLTELINLQSYDRSKYELGKRNIDLN